MEHLPIKPIPITEQQAHQILWEDMTSFNTLIRKHQLKSIREAVNYIGKDYYTTEYTTLMLTYLYTGRNLYKELIAIIQDHKRKQPLTLGHTHKHN